MKTSLHCRRAAFVTVALLLTVNVSLLQAAAGRTNSPVPRAAVSADAAPAEQEIPQSVFAMPATRKDGKDPFFPRSDRPYHVAIPTPVTPTNPAPRVVDLKINGTSGNDERPLVIINNVTFGIGDTREVMSENRRVEVRCLEIDLSAGKATVEVAGNRRVLFFQKLVK